MTIPAGEQDPYLVLGVERTATEAEIRAAYRKLGAKYHPDRHQGNPLEELASAKMAEINRAYEILSDPARRAAFDRGGFGAGASHRASAGPAEPGGSAAAGPGTEAGRRVLQVDAVLSLIPLVIRFGGVLVRLGAVLVRELLEGAALLRGTPFAAAAVVLVAAVLVGALIRKRRHKRRASPR